MKYLLLLLLSSSLYAIEAVDALDKSVEEELQEIVVEMTRMETNLRLDRTDESVQLKGKEIQDKLEKLIKDVEINSVKTKFNTLRQKQLAQIAGIVPPTPFIQTLPEGEALFKPGILNNDFRNSWAKLDSKNRELILQSYQPDIPLKWQLRIAAYYLSIATEEVKVKKK